MRDPEPLQGGASSSSLPTLGHHLAEHEWRSSKNHSKAAQPHSWQGRVKQGSTCHWALEGSVLMTLLGLRESQTGFKTPPSSSDLSKNDHIGAATSCLPLPATWLPKHSWPKHHIFIFCSFWLPELAHCTEQSPGAAARRGEGTFNLEALKTCSYKTHKSTKTSQTVSPSQNLKKKKRINFCACHGRSTRLQGSSPSGMSQYLMQ